MNHRTYLDKDLTDAERRLASLVMIGTVSGVRPSEGRVRVTSGNVTTDWLTFATSRAGNDRTWHMPELKEQVIVVSPCGDIAQAVVIGALYQDAYPPPANSVDIHRVVYQDGTTLEYNRAAHLLRINVMGSIAVNATADMTFKCGGKMSFDASDIAMQEGCENA